MKKVFSFITLILAFTLLSLCGCTKAPADNGYKSELTGIVNIAMVEKDSFYYPTITGEITLSEQPDSLTLSCAGEEIKLNVVSINPTNNGLLTLSFKQTHIFGVLTAQEYSIDLTFTVAGETINVENFGAFTCDDEYFGINGYDETTGTYFYAMDKESNWTGNY